MTSSGTTGQKVSRIFLDRTTSANQQKTMVKIVSSFTGSERMPMIIIDCPSVIKDRNMFSRQRRRDTLILYIWGQEDLTHWMMRCIWISMDFKIFSKIQ